MKDMTSSASGAAPLSDARTARFANGPGDGLIIRDPGVPNLLMVRAREDRSPLLDAFDAVLGLPLPGPLRSTVSAHRIARWMSPDAWLVSVGADELESTARALQSALDGHGAVVDVSGGYAVLELSGPALMDVLKKSTSYDVHPDNFASGKVVNTSFAKAGVTLRAGENGVCELIVRRSFAHYVFQWLTDAASEHGLSFTTG